MRDKLARRWAQGWTLTQMGKELELSRAGIAGLIARARKHGDGDRFRPRPAPEPKPKVRQVKPAGEVVGNTRPLPPPPEPPKP